MQTVLFAGDVDSACRDADGVVCFDRVGGTVDRDGTSRDFDVVLTGDAVVGGADGECACAVEYEVILGENDRVGVGASVCGEAACDAEIVVAQCGDKDLIRVLDVNDRCIGVGNADAVQYQLYLRVVRRFNGDGDVFRGTADDIHAFFGDADILTVAECDGFGIAQICRLCQISLGKEVGRVNFAC